MLTRVLFFLFFFSDVHDPVSRYPFDVQDQHSSRSHSQDTNSKSDLNMANFGFL